MYKACTDYGVLPTRYDLNYNSTIKGTLQVIFTMCINGQHVLHMYLLYLVVQQPAGCCVVSVGKVGAAEWG